MARKIRIYRVVRERCAAGAVAMEHHDWPLGGTGIRVTREPHLARNGYPTTLGRFLGNRDAVDLCSDGATARKLKGKWRQEVQDVVRRVRILVGGAEAPDVQAQQQPHNVTQEGHEFTNRAGTIALARYSKQRHADPRKITHIQLQHPLAGAPGHPGERFERHFHELPPRVATALIREGLAADNLVAVERDFGAGVRRADGEVVDEPSDFARAACEREPRLDT